MGSDCAWIASIAVECSSSRFFPVESSVLLLAAAPKSVRILTDFEVCERGGERWPEALGALGAELGDA